MQQDFTKILLEWSKCIERNMPWKGEGDPYLIWLSEIILQQTRVEQGTPYYLKFKEKFPDVYSLANASQDQVLKLWQGLGYYSRARNMHSAAQHVVNELGGEFPKDYKGLKSLKGVGDYTAAAIASFAYNQAHAVVDGNVYRVLARYFGIDTPIDTTEGKKAFKALANQLLSESEPAAYNQAIMDFGALQCVPGKPDCNSCPLNDSCRAFDKDIVPELPVKSKRIQRRERYFHYLVIRKEKSLFLKKRVEKDIWKNLYDFPIVEHDKKLKFSQLKQEKLWRDLLDQQAYKDDKTPVHLHQILTHQKINGMFFQVQVEDDYQPPLADLIEVEREKLNNFAFPKLINCYLEDKILYSNIT